MARRRRFGVLFVLVVFLAVPRVAVAEKAVQRWQRVAEILGKEGILSSDGVYKITFPRTDLHVTLDGVPLAVGMGLASWAAFTRTPDGKVLVMGDTAMRGSEVNAVIDALRAGGIEVVALHNHMRGEQPPLLFLHYQARGEAEALAQTIRRALDELGESKPRN